MNETLLSYEEGKAHLNESRKWDERPQIATTATMGRLRLLVSLDRLRCSERPELQPGGKFCQSCGGTAASPPVWSLNSPSATVQHGKSTASQVHIQAITEEATKPSQTPVPPRLCKTP